MKNQLSLALFSCWVLLFASACSKSTPQEPAVDSVVKASSEELYQAHQKQQKIPVLSVENPQLDVSKAYQIQKAYIGKRLKTEQFFGLKAGLTSEGGQKRFGVKSPLAGVLLSSGKKEKGTTLKRTEFGTLMLETEIGFILGESIHASLSNVEEFKKKVRVVLPVIEVPDLGFSNMKELKGVDLIAGNVAARQYILGSSLAKDKLDLNEIIVRLTLNGKVVNEGKGSDASGNQWEAALWLVNTMVEQGWTLEEGNLLITGALGKMIPGKPGKYFADYGDAGSIEFTIE